MKRLLTLIAIVLLYTTFSSAGPIVPKDVDANAKWFGHVNAEALHSMKLVQDLKAMFPGQQRYQAKMDKFAKKLGMNSIEDVSGITLYSKQYGGQVGVILVYVKNLDRERMIGMLKEEHPDHKTSEYGNRTLYSWTGGLHRKAMKLTGTFANDSLVVIGTGTKQVKAALDVLDGKKAGLAKDAALLKDIPDNALFACRGIDVPDEFRKITRCPILHNCKSASAIWSEKDGQITGTYEFDTMSEDAAKSYKAIVEGFMAMGQLRYNDLPAVGKVLDGLKVEISGTIFSATFTTSSDDVEAAIKAVKEREKLRPHRMKHHGPKRDGGKEKK